MKTLELNLYWILRFPLFPVEDLDHHMQIGDGFCRFSRVHRGT